MKNLSNIDKDRIIEMAWEDRSPFEAIFFQFNISKSSNSEYYVNTQNLPNGTYFVRLANGYLQHSQILNISH